MTEGNKVGRRERMKPVIRDACWFIWGAVFASSVIRDWGYIDPGVLFRAVLFALGIAAGMILVTYIVVLVTKNAEN
jgi:hypothetical protein